MSQSRSVYILGFILAAGSIAYSVYLQTYKAMIPCHLCMLQLCAMSLLALLFLLAILQHPKKIGDIFYGLLIFIVGSFGAVIAGREYYLQKYGLSCSASSPESFWTALNKLPVLQVLSNAYQGTGSCSVKADWNFLSLGLPEWALILFIIIAVLGLTKIFGRNK